MYILELNTILPHKKSRDVQFDFVRQIHKEIDKNINIQMFNKAFVGIVILTPSGYANGKPWDTDNRALNLVFISSGTPPLQWWGRRRRWLWNRRSYVGR